MVMSAHVRIPLFFTPVPITMQTFVLFLSVLILSRQAFFSQAIYIVLGIAGLPVFTNGGAGLLYLLGPTGGYIVGFLLVAFILPFLLPEKRTFIKVFFVFLFGASLYYLTGVSWLVFYYKFSFLAALAAGVAPFIIGDILKIVLVSSLATRRR
jgi:biotin transport system substrate-specific component